MRLPVLLLRRAACASATCSVAAVEYYSSAEAANSDNIARAALLNTKWLSEERQPEYCPPDASWPKVRPYRSQLPELRQAFADCGGLLGDGPCHSKGSLLAFALLGGVLFGHAEPEDDDETPESEEMSEAHAAEGVNLLRLLADAGQAEEAACGFAMCLAEGHGGKEADEQAAIQYYAKSAAMGYPHAQHALGCAYYLGEGTDVDEARAVHFFSLAAEQGHPNAMYMLGECMLEGKGTPVAREKAFGWLFAAGEAGHVGARARIRCSLLGMPFKRPLRDPDLLRSGLPCGPGGEPDQQT